MKPGEAFETIRGQIQSNPVEVSKQPTHLKIVTVLLFEQSLVQQQHGYNGWTMLVN